MSARPTDGRLEMKVELAVIENLGLKMYVTLPPVISEIIANSWDADAHNVRVKLPAGSINESSEITIEDDGVGMTFDEINNLFLRIGRKRREEEHRDKTPEGRKLMGCKGIGKLAPFGVVEVVELETCKDNILNSFRMDINEIMKCAREGRRYYPPVLKSNVKVEKGRGTTVRLRKLKRTTALDVASYRRGIAERFSIISSDFQVYVNDDPITPEDWLKKENMQYCWAYEDKLIDEEHPEWTISGWIGTAFNPLDEDQRGIIVMTRGKLCQTPFFFGVNVGEKHSYAYMAGILHAEFLDAEEDFVATHRSSFIEGPPGSALTKWGQEETRRIAREWQQKRREEREKIIRESSKFKEWLTVLPAAEKKIADKVITAITSDEQLSDERRLELASFMVDSFEQKVFHEMVASLPEEPEDARLIEVFEEWGFIEAKEILRLVEGRISTIEQFDKFVKEDAKEVPTIHNFFKEWPWILDPTWTRWNDEVYFSELLRKNFPDEKLEGPDRRIDFVCIGSGDTVHVVELKRPKHKVNAKDLEQLLEYVAFVRGRLGNAPDRPYRDSAGYIVAGEISDDYVTREKIKVLSEGRMYVKRYGELLTVAHRLHEDLERKLNEFEDKRRQRVKRVTSNEMS